MKTLELSEEEFQFLGSLIGHCFCGNHPTLMAIFSPLNRLNNGNSFDAPHLNHQKSRPGCLYLEAPYIGKVLSYNIQAGRAAQACQREIEEVIQRYNGVVIDV